MTEEKLWRGEAILQYIRDFYQLNSFLNQCEKIEITTSANTYYYNAREKNIVFDFIKKELPKLIDNKISELEKEFEEL